METMMPAGPAADGRTTSGNAEDLTDLDAWRWRNYMDHLADLDYVLDGGRPQPDETRDLANA